ncbi:MAG: zinc ribbon domain-containing protein [Candidatus Zixiibacteriota bacterium]|nr:MAG: zinc ribbon domain-containing protein [candidate division Zixibacteria bacterium]
MPTYEYRCTDCGREFEEFQAISDPPITICERCGGKTERIISGGAGLIFKGSGFYITDYGRGTSGKPAGKKEPGITKPSGNESSSSGSSGGTDKSSTSDSG